MELIKVNNRKGVFLKLDKEVAEKIGGWTWSLNNKGLAQAHVPKSGTPGKLAILSHAVIWATTGEWPKKGVFVCNKNKDPLDCHFKDLVLSEKMIFQSKTRRNRNRNRIHHNYIGIARVGYKEIYYYTGIVRIQEDQRKMSFSGSSTKDEDTAARARDCIVDLIGGFTHQNFPEETFEGKWMIIGEKQRRKILKSFEKNGMITERVKILTKLEKKRNDELLRKIYNVGG
jgi:hypothetical protein